MNVLATGAASTVNSPAHLLIALVFVAVYLVPTIVAWTRHVHPVPVTIINVLLGWTVLGWIAALVMACRPTLVTR